MSKLVICRHITRVEPQPLDHTEKEICQVCGQIVKHYSFDTGENKRKSSVLRFGRVGKDFVAINPKHSIETTAAGRQEYIEAENNTPAGSLVFNLPVESKHEPTTATPDAPESKSEGTPVLTPSPMEVISQEMKAEEIKSKPVLPDKRLLQFRANHDIDQVKKDFQSLVLVDFRKKYNLTDYTWRRLQPELGIAKKGRGKGKRSVFKKKVPPVSVPKPKQPPVAPLPFEAFTARLQAVASVLPALPAFDPTWSVLVQEQWLKTWSETLRYIMVYMEEYPE